MSTVFGKAAGARARARGGTSILAQGENMLWLMGGALAVCTVMIVGLLVLVVYQGTTTFWPRPIVEVTMQDGHTYMGEVTRHNTFTPTPEAMAAWSDSVKSVYKQRMIAGDTRTTRRLVRTGNFEISGTHFEWVDDVAVAHEQRPAWAVVIERRAWGRFYGIPTAFRVDGKAVATDPADIWKEFNRYHDAVSARFERRYRLQKHDFGALHAQAERARLAVRRAEIEHGEESPEAKAQHDIYDGEMRAIDARRKALDEEVRLLDDENARYDMKLATASGDTATISMASVVRAYPANRLGPAEKVGVYLSRWGEFLTADPREANSEGGVFPAIFGTVVMTLLMSLAVVPFGVLAALYLREYARRRGSIVSAVRIAMNNMAGVPSIVFGVFGLGFFCYIVGGGDRSRCSSPTSCRTRRSARAVCCGRR